MCADLLLLLLLCRSKACPRWRPVSRPISCECTQSNCRSEPARDDGVSGDIDVESTALIAGKPAPTIIRLLANPGYTHQPCGSWLASDGGLTADQFLATAPNPTVGASLLAMAAEQSTMFNGE
ncbi:hypothetical protein D3C86_1559380 [compost metagenome]